MGSSCWGREGRDQKVLVDISRALSENIIKVAAAIRSRGQSNPGFAGQQTSYCGHHVYSTQAWPIPNELLKHVQDKMCPAAVDLVLFEYMLIAHRGLQGSEKGR